MQFFRRNRYRFFYPAGLISLILLPLLGYFYLYQKGAFQQEYVIEIHSWYPELASSWPDPRLQRKYKVFELDGNKAKDDLTLKQFHNEILLLRTNNDTINGLQIIFGPKSKYSSMIESYNICFKENVRYWTTYQNSLWVFHKIPRKATASFDWPCLLCDDLVIEKPKLTYVDVLLIEWNDITTTIKQAKSFWPAGILYIIMVSLTAQKVVKQFRNQPRTTSN